eukprot:696925-Amphidinium_carterae.1
MPKSYIAMDKQQEGNRETLSEMELANCISQVLLAQHCSSLDTSGRALAYVRYGTETHFVL